MLWHSAASFFKSKMFFANASGLAISHKIAFFLSVNSDKDKFLNMGFNGYISKPIDTRMVNEQIIQYVKK